VVRAGQRTGITCHHPNAATSDPLERTRGRAKRRSRRLPQPRRAERCAAPSSRAASCPGSWLLTRCPGMPSFCATCSRRQPARFARVRPGGLDGPARVAQERASRGSERAYESVSRTRSKGPDLARRDLRRFGGTKFRHAASNRLELSIETTQMEFKSPKEIARLCGLSPRAIYRAISRGELRASRLCGRLRCRTIDVEDWIEHNLVVPVPTLQQPLPDRRPTTAGRGSLRRMLSSEGEGSLER
jgi:excisionase family DNA binding protein